MLRLPLYRRIPSFQGFLSVLAVRALPPVPVKHQADHPQTPPYPRASQAVMCPRPRSEAILAPELTSALFLRSFGEGGMADNLDVLNAAISLLMRAALLAARLSGRTRQRYLKHLTSPPEGALRPILAAPERSHRRLTGTSATIVGRQKRRGPRLLNAGPAWFHCV